MNVGIEDQTMIRIIERHRCLHLDLYATKYHELHQDHQGVGTADEEDIAIEVQGADMAVAEGVEDMEADPQAVVVEEVVDMEVGDIKETGTDRTITIDH